MPRSKDQFRSEFVLVAEAVEKRKLHVRNEEGTKTSLVLPFVRTLGYDDADPQEFVAEHHADFSEKMPRRVDYAIFIDGVPLIAIECKSVGSLRSDDKGQLKAYFNAVKSVKMGILTDGIVYQFFVDSNDPNLMDDEPFLTLDLSLVARGDIPTSILDSVFSITKEKFNAETITEEARRASVYNAVVRYFSREFKDPSVEFVRFVLSANQFKYVKANKIDAFSLIVKEALSDVFKNFVAEKLGMIDKNSSDQSQKSIIAVTDLKSENAQDDELFDIVMKRIIFLSSGDENLFNASSEIMYDSLAGKMIMYYKGRNKGRLVEVLRGPEPVYSVVADDGLKSSKKLTELDSHLIAIFKKRVAEVR
jgi:predicted type IV restriction endonuclease